jgi:DNA-binding NarL/FixJ family response regulator
MNLDQSPRRWRVVVAEDDDDMRVLVRIMLERDGRFDIVAEATDGGGAVDAILAKQPDVVVLDLGLPVMDGATALSVIKEVAPHCRVAVCSASRDGASEILLSGADVFVDKLDVPRSLAHVLDELCAQPG